MSEKPGQQIDLIGSRDTSLTSRLRMGEEAAIGEIMHAYYEKLLRIAHVMTGSLDFARDAVQNVFIKLWDLRDTIDPDIDLGGYLVVAVRHQALNILRTER